MSTLMDLTSGDCGYDVDFLTDVEDKAELKRSWIPEVADEVFQKVQIHDASFQPAVQAYGKIVLFGKPQLVLGTEPNAGVVASVVHTLLQDPEQSRNRTSVHWIDQPFRRCHEMPDGEHLCAKLPSMIESLAKVAHEFHVLTEEDKASLQREVAERNVEVNVDVWPLRIQNLMRILGHTEQPQPSVQGPQYLLVNGRTNAAKTANIQMLFSSGALSSICAQIRMTRSQVRVLFMGPLALEALRLFEVANQTQNLDCVSIHTSYVDEYVYRQDVQPRIRATLNPMFFNVTAGSTTNLESLALATPTITSELGVAHLQGLQDCDFPTSPRKPKDLPGFIVDHIIDGKNFKAFSNYFLSLRKKCSAGQDAKYPVKLVCS